MTSARASWLAFQKVFLSGTRPIATATAWDSMVAAASEEWVDETIFEFVPHLASGLSVKELAAFIVLQAAGQPDLATLFLEVSSHFGLSDQEAGQAVDRALGGACRAAALSAAARPDGEIDPVAAEAFDLASIDHSIIDAIYPDWREWKPGYYSET